MMRFTKTLATAALAVWALSAIVAAPASAAYGLTDLGIAFSGADGSPSMQAGSHPFAFTNTLGVNTTINPETGKEVPDGETKDLKISLPPGFVGNPNAVPRCSSADFLSSVDGSFACPDASALGVAAIEIGFGERGFLEFPVYNLEPAPGVAAKVGFIAIQGIPVTIDIGVNPDPPYNLIAHVNNISQEAFFYHSEVTLWGTPVDSAHDGERGHCLDSGGTCHVSIPEKPFMTMPVSCTGPLVTTFEADPWQSPGTFVTGQAATHDNSVPPNPLGITGCGNLNFSPHTTAKATNQAAGSPTGLDVGVDFNDEGLTSPDGIAQSDIQKAVVTLPVGMTANPSLAEGLKTCSPADLSREAVDSEAGQGCPEASKIGTVEVETPLLEGTLLKGQVFIATQDENPFNSLLAFYIVIKEPKLGVMVKLAAKIEPDEKTGQLVTTIDQIPQFPFSHFRFHFREGGRSPLVTPPACGEYAVKSELTPSGDPSRPLTTSASFNVTTGPGGSPCPASGVPPFHPGFEAGSINNNAGSYSPFYMRLTRKDGEQDMTRFDAVLPPGVTGKLAGVAKCSESQIAAAKTKSGRQELAAPTCPATTQIGRTLAGVGVGSELTYVPGKLYLAGPFGGDPLSVVAITPAVAGPFDVGTVVVREALTLNPETAEVEVDGAHSEPIPHILKGIPLKLRDLRVYVDRQNFTLNPTSCDPESARATLFGDFLDVFNPADDVPVSLSARYQAAGCAALAFKPKLSLKLSGGTKRGSHPALRAVVTYPKGAGYANVAKAVVTLPHSAFLEQAHIRTVCTRVQFSAHACPQGSIYGKVKAFTPLLEEPLQGPVYLRSSSHPLPDLVFALHGLVDVNVVARVDSINARIRTTISSAPDAPLSKFILEMQGGKKGLIVNSRNLCAHKSKAIAELTAQSGKPFDTEPVVKVDCGK